MKILSFENMPILVTGGAGFIGSHLCQRLVELGAKVRIVDNLSTGQLENLQNIMDKVEFFNGDITDFNTCINVTENQKIVFHLAAFVSVPDSMKNPNKCNEININGIMNLLEASRINNIDKFIFSSSSAVYGNKNEICNEEDICEPTSVYGYSKLIGEILCRQYASIFGLKTINLRYFNVYGPRQNAEGAYAAVVARFMEQMKLNKPITIYGDGMQKRDFIHVNQIVEANIKLSLLDAKELDGQAINIASGNSISLLELIQKIKKDFPEYCLEPIFKQERPGDIKISQASCTKYKTLCGL